MTVKFKYLPPDIQNKILEISKRYPYAAEEVTPYYMMGGSLFTEVLLQAKLRGFSDQLIISLNFDLWEAENKRAWAEIADNT